MKMDLNKWQTTCYFGRDYKTLSFGWKILRFGIFKLTSIPEEGTMITKPHHKGFIFEMKLWIPIDSIEIY